MYEMWLYTYNIASFVTFVLLLCVSCGAISCNVKMNCATSKASLQKRIPKPPLKIQHLIELHNTTMPKKILNLDIIPLPFNYLSNARHDSFF